MSQRPTSTARKSNKRRVIQMTRERLHNLEAKIDYLYYKLNLLELIIIY